MSLYEQFKDLNEEELFNRIDILVKNQEEESYCLDFKHHESLNFLLKKGDKDILKLLLVFVEPNHIYISRIIIVDSEIRIG